MTEMTSGWLPVYLPMDWIVGVPDTFWLFGSGTPPWPSSRDWTANTVWLSMPEEEEEEEDEETVLYVIFYQAPLYVTVRGCMYH